jgi:hypothetical protein
MRVWGYTGSSSLNAQMLDGKGQAVRFTQADNGVITDQVTGLEGWHGIDYGNGRQVLAMRSRN